MPPVICNFSDVYKSQPYLEGLRVSGKAKWLDFTDIAGTDCYCDSEAEAAIRKRIADAGIGTAQGIHFIDSGNYHYMSKIWTDMIQEPFSLVVFDHHPDMQEPRFGNILSCGGWVLEALKSNPFVQSVTLIGVADHLVDEIRAEISQTESADVLDKVTFIKESEIRTALHSQFYSYLKVRDSGRPHTSYLIYLSIDKDSLSPAYAATNWDQGSLDVATLKKIINSLAENHKINGIDICGERARDTEDSRADALNNALNRELAEFMRDLR